MATRLTCCVAQVLEDHYRRDRSAGGGKAVKIPAKQPAVKAKKKSKR